MTAAGSPHSETLGSKPARRLPEAYRCPPRLSSVPSAKASTIRPCRQPHTRGTRKTKRTPDDRSSTLCDHKTIKQTTRPPKRGPGRNTSVQADHNQPPQQGRPRGPLASTLQFSNHHATPHTPTRRQPDRNPWRAPERQPPNTRRAVAAREPNSMPIPAPTTGTQRSFHASTPDTPGRKPREPCQALNNILRRKEVIQPHLPVRLPCYDLVPITSLTLDGSPQQNWSGHRLRVLPTFMT